MDRNGELHAPNRQSPIHTEQKDGFFGTEKNLLPPAHSGYCTDYAIPATFCVLEHTFSTANIKKYSDVRIFTIRQGHAQYLIITEESEEALSVLILCHHKDPGTKGPDV